MTLCEVEVGLAASDPEERRRAAARLAGVPVAGSVPLLLQALGDEDWRVRKEATGVAAALAPAPEVLRALVEVLRPDEENVGRRNAAVEALGGFGAAAVDSLSVTVSGLDADGRKLAAEALGRTGEVAALVVLRTLITDADPNVSAAAIEAVASIGTTGVDDVAPLLTACLDVDDPFQRLAALHGLNQIGVILPWPRIRGLLDESLLRPEALIAAGRAAPPEAAPVLVRALDQPRRAIRTSAQRGLVDFVRAGDEALLVGREALRDLSDANRRRLLDLAAQPSEALDERRGALVLIGALGGDEAARVAVDGLADEQVAPEAEEALVALGDAALPALIEKMRSATGADRALAIELTGRLAGEASASEAADAILPTLETGSAEVVEAALTALARVGGESSLRPAARWLHSDVARVRRGAAAAIAAISRRHPQAARDLARLATPDGPDALAASVIAGALPPPVRGSLDQDVSFLSDALAADSTLVRRAALDALAGLGSTLAVDAVAFALTDEEPDVRRAAVHALGSMRDSDRGAPGLDHLLDLVRRSTDEDLVVSAVHALGRAGDPRAIEVLRPLVRGGDPLVAVHAVEALGRIDAPDRSQALAEALVHTDVEVVKAALQTLVDDDDPVAEQHLAQCLDHLAWDVRRLSADLLGRAGGHGAMAQLRTRLASEKEPLVREALQRALVELESADVPVRRTTPPPMRER